MLLQIAGKPIWWIAPELICVCVQPLLLILVFIGLAERFGKGGGYGLGLVLLPYVFLPMLGFGKNRYTPAPAQI